MRGPAIRRSARSLFGAAWALSVVWLACGLVLAQPPSSTDAEVPPPPVEDIEEPLLDEPPVSEAEGAMIDDLLSGGEEALDTGEVYDPGSRRDPFRSLMRVTEPTRDAGPRPEGLPGLLIDEVSVTGIWQTQSGPVAQVQSSDNPVSYLLRPGDQVFDGEVLTIRLTRGEGGEVVFRQVVQDPDAPRPFREVTKRLNP